MSPMKNNILTIALITLLSFIGIAQNSTDLVADQNPNYHISLDKYMTENKVSDLTLLQGTTAQETYTAIDPMEEKRKRKALRRYSGLYVLCGDIKSVWNAQKTLTITTEDTEVTTTETTITEITDG